MFNLSKKLFYVVSVPLLCSVAVNTYAVDGTITITGKVVDETCILKGSTNTNNAGEDIAVVLDTVKKSVFSPTSLTAGTKSFDLQLVSGNGSTACDAVTNSGFKGIHITTTSAADYLATNSTALINTIARDSISPVYIQLLTDTNAEVDYAAAWGVQAKSAVTFKNNLPTLTYQARYFTETGVVEPQDVSAVVNYTLQYN